MLCVPTSRKWGSWDTFCPLFVSQHCEKRHFGTRFRDFCVPTLQKRGCWDTFCPHFVSQNRKNGHLGTHPEEMLSPFIEKQPGGTRSGGNLRPYFSKTFILTIFLVDKRKDQYDNFISQRKSKSKSIKSKVKND